VVLVGRVAEVAALDRLLAEAREGRSGVLVLRGEAGIGKSALLEHALAQAGGMTVLRGAGIESESELAFAALHQVLRPVLDRIDRLPGPQAGALRAAFGLSDEQVDDRFRSSVGVLGLVAEAAEERPVLCLVDDAQWLDQPSADALLFAARRVMGERLAMVFAVREDPARPFVAAGLPELHVGPLEAADARALLDERIGLEAPPDVVEMLLEQANGNPLALLELPAVQGGTWERGTSVEQAYLERVARLPEDARRVLVVAACEESGDRATVARAAASLGLVVDDLAAAEADGLVSVGPDRIDFRHPLVRSAVYRGAPFTEREQTHRALASVLNDEHDADRAAWHRASATVGADEDVAAELEATAERARHRAGHGAAAAALERAAELSRDPALQGRRLVLAAAAAGRSGRMARAAALAQRGEELVTDPVLRADAALVLGTTEHMTGRPDRAFEILSAASKEVAPHDGDRRFELAALSLQTAALSGDPLRIAEGARLIAEIEPRNDRELTMSMICKGVGHVLSGNVEAGAAALSDGVARAKALGDPRDLLVAANATTFLGNDEQGRALFVKATADVRAAGSLSLLVHVLTMSAWQNFLARQFAEAASQADEAVRLARELGIENPAIQARSILAWIAAFHGRVDECMAEADAVAKVANARGIALTAGMAVWALAELDLGRGEWAAALERFDALSQWRPGFGHPFLTLWSAPDRVEAAIRAGRSEQAREAAATLEGWATSTGAAWARPLVARSHGLLAESAEEALEHYEQALALHEQVGGGYNRARTELLYGELLRRERRRLDARRVLRASLATFEQLGAALWAERAGAELRATGETARKRDPSAVAQLTPQEQQIATLVAGGGSNKEIAAQLFLSPRTVEYHLRKVFAKLGISSRAELIRARAAEGDVLAGVS
jgi:DNA-binding CsgD family transcriptional regulator